MKSFTRGFKTLRLFLALVIVLVLAVPAWPAAITLTNAQFHSVGSLYLITGTASVGSGDTLVVGLGTITSVNIIARNALGSQNPVVWYSLSGRTITIFTEGVAAGGGSMTYDFMIFGF